MMRTATLLAATVTTGVVAGLFYAFSICVMPGLRGTDDRTFVDVMQRVNVAILNGWFALCFGGALVCTGAAVVQSLSRRGEVWPVAAALTLYVVVLAITFAVNVPLNNRLQAAGAPAGLSDPAAVRAAFEDLWVRWNVVRAVVSTAAFACLCWSLLRASA